MKLGAPWSQAGRDLGTSGPLEPGTYGLVLLGKSPPSALPVAQCHPQEPLPGVEVTALASCRQYYLHPGQYSDPISNPDLAPKHLSWYFSETPKAPHPFFWYLGTNP
jgi:hypothetical protein